MQWTAEPVARLIGELGRLPGIGPKTAQRLAFYLLRAPADQARDLANAIVDVKERIGLCSVCYNITESDPCGICRNPARDQSRLCVVEEPLDVIALERTREFRGQYHVLHGALNPLNGVGPDDLRLRELVVRVKNGTFAEVILATNPNLEGEATAQYVFKLLAPLGTHVTRIAHGLPVGGDLEYADAITLTRSLEGRRTMRE